MGIDKTRLEHGFEAQHWSQAQFFVQNDQRSARHLMVIARMPEDSSNTFKNLQTPSTTFKHLQSHID
eukprot:3032859-Heterocapsa_arctica.AAC.1